MRRQRPVAYVMRCGPDGGTAVAGRDGHYVYARCGPPVPLDVGGRFGRRVKRLARKASRNKLVRGIAKAAMTVARIYPGTAAAAAAIDTARAAVSELRDADPVNAAELAAAAALDRAEAAATEAATEAAAEAAAEAPRDPREVLLAALLAEGGR